MNESWRRKAKNRVKRALRRVGYDIAPYDQHGGSLANHLASLFRLLRIDCVIDVGAHVGWYGRFLREIGYEGYIVSFEPLQENFTELARWTTDDPRWTAHLLALSDFDGHDDLRVAARTDFSSFRPTTKLGLELFAGMAETTRIERVGVARLDTVIDTVTADLVAPRLFLKLDTQGHELTVLRGASACLDRILGVQAELSVKPLYEGIPPFEGALGQLRTAGYDLTDAFPVGRGPRLEALDVDCVFVRRSAPDARA